jgi:hypothetical protein
VDEPGRRPHPQQGSDQGPRAVDVGRAERREVAARGPGAVHDDVGADVGQYCADGGRARPGEIEDDVPVRRRAGAAAGRDDVDPRVRRGAVDARAELAPRADEQRPHHAPLSRVPRSEGNSALARS